MTDRRKALLLMGLSTASMSLMQFVVKLSNGVFPLWEQVFVRNFVTLILGAALVVRQGTPFFGHRGNRLALLLRSVLGFIGVAGYFYATSRIGLADASLLHRSSPFFVIVFSVLILSKPLLRSELVGLILAFAGAVLVINPSFSNINLAPSLIGLLSAAGAGGAYVAIAWLKGREKNGTILFFFSLVSCVLSTVFGFGTFVMPRGAQWLMLGAIGLFAAIGQVCLTQAYKMANPGEVSVINYLGIVFSAVLGLAFLGEVPGGRSIIGILCVFAAALVIYLSEDSKPVARRGRA